MFFLTISHSQLVLANLRKSIIEILMDMCVMFWDEVCDHLFNAIFTVPPKIQLFIREANSRIVSSVNFQ